MTSPGWCSVVTAELDAAFEAGLDLGGVVLEAAERLDRAVVHDLAGADHAGLGGAADEAFGDHATGDLVLLAQREDRADLGGAEAFSRISGSRSSDIASFTSVMSS
jgi:hypothetical protein